MGCNKCLVLLLEAGRRSRVVGSSQEEFCGWVAELQMKGLQEGGELGRWNHPGETEGNPSPEDERDREQMEMLILGSE